MILNDCFINNNSIKNDFEINFNNLLDTYNRFRIIY